MKESQQAWSDCVSQKEELNNLVDEVSQPIEHRKSSRYGSRDSQSQKGLSNSMMHPQEAERFENMSDGPDDIEMAIKVRRIEDQEEVDVE